MKKRIIFVTLFTASLFTACDEQPATVLHKRKTITHQSKTAIISADTICIAAVGDIMLGSSYPNSNNLPPDSGKKSFAAALKDLNEADLTFGNLEGTLLDTGAPDLKKKFKRYLFRMPAHYGTILSQAGFNVLSIANNHISDFGFAGRKSTANILDSCGIHYAGLQTQPATIFTNSGVKYGFCAFSPNSYVVSQLDLKNVTNIIQNLKKQVDIVVVSFHGGGEGVDFEHVLCQKEAFIGENRGDVHEFAHTAIDAGADVVFGNGPHVSRAMENYNKRLIAYSLGNFCTYKSVSVLGVCGMAPLLKVYLNKKGEFMHGKIISFKQTHLNGLERDTQNRAAARIKYLTEVDFPQSGLKISDSGQIVPAQ